jgi:hypothetical protein
MCNCGGRTQPKTAYVYLLNGTKTTYTSEVQARAAQIRNGGQGTITPVPVR